MSSTRRILANIAFGLGSVWAVAGAFKLLFGVRLTLPILPPLGLERVAPIPSLMIAAALFIIGALLGRAQSSLGPAMAMREY